MEDSTIPVSVLPLNPLATIAVEVIPTTGQRAEIQLNSLCRMLYKLESSFFVDALPDAHAEVTFDLGSSCPVCLENYFNTLAEGNTALEAAEKARVENVKPLRLQCGHVFGRTCLLKIFSQSELTTNRCPLCRQQIAMPMVPDNDLWSHGRKNITVNLLALLCIAIRLYLRLDPNTNPETHRALKDWIYSLPYEVEGPESWSDFSYMKSAAMLEILGEDVICSIIRNRSYLLQVC